MNSAKGINFYSGKISIVIIMLLCIISRLPQLMSSNLILDGDECVVGLMAKHIMEGKGLPLFFYGQAYGFSFVECMFILPFYAVFGICTLSVKCAMLLMWTVGVVYLYKAFVQINNKNPVLPFLLILVLIFSPAWAVASMKALGGYLTAFMLMPVLLYLLFLQRIKYPVFVYAVMGVLLVIIYESQPLWVPGIILLICYKLAKEHNVKTGIAFLITAISTFIPFSFYRRALPQNTPRLLSSGAEIAPFLKRIPYDVFSSMHGNYFANRVMMPDVCSALFAYLFCGAILFLILVALYGLVRGRKGFGLFNLTIGSVMVTLLCSVLFEEMHPRYLLPVAGYALLAMLFYLQAVKVNYGLLGVFGSCVMILGIVSMMSFKNYRFSTMRKDKFGGLLVYLKDNHIQYTYCYDYMLCYQVAFYSKEKIISREKVLPGTYPPYAKLVDSAYNAGAKTALIFNELQLRARHFKDVRAYNGYMVAVDAERGELGRVIKME